MTIHLQDIEKMVLDLLERSKDPLLQVLRGWDEGRFVPSEIEAPVKYIIKHFTTIAKVQTHMYNNKTYHIHKINNSFLVACDEDQKEYILKIDKVKTGRSHRKIQYENKEFYELWEHGNTYNHIVSQAEKIKKWLEIDKAAGLISQDDVDSMIVYNYFHDIPEMGDQSDVIIVNKTDDHRNVEDALALQIIDQQDWSEAQKNTLYDIIDVHHKKGLFKLYEIMVYLIDIQYMIQHAAKHNASIHFAGAVIGHNFSRFLEDYQLPNGQIMRGIDLPSFRAHAKEHVAAVDETIGAIDRHGVTAKRKERYLHGKEVREKTIKPHIQ